MADHCIVCADPLNYCAYGRCGHKETCSRCVARLRSVLKDQRCAYCQQQLGEVFVTRFAGDYTQQVLPDDFDRLQARAAAGELHHLPACQAFFDDASHFQEIRSLCSFTHPAAFPSAAPAQPFPSLRTLRSHLQHAHKLSFCDICLEGRKVFVSEQQVYSRAALDRHLKQGDEEGAMAESGFRGHPECHFCRRRFYGENELYLHMHATHEQCFLCRRSHPQRHVYFRDYPDLEKHFKADHFPCDHPDCLEQKFVVFHTQQELKTHTAREHAQGLSRSERKQALTIPVAFTYRRGDQGSGASTSAAAAGLAAVAAGGQGAVVIGGAASVPSRFSQQQRRGSRNALQEAASVQASLQSAAEEHAARSADAAATAQPPPRQQQQQPGALRELDFPSVSSSGATPAFGGRWAGGGASGATGQMREEDFPALPGTSKSARRRTNSKKKTAAQAEGGGGSVRVVNAADRGLASFPALGASSQQLPALVALRRGEGDEWQQAAPRGMRRPPSSQEVRPPAHLEAQEQEPPPTQPAQAPPRPGSAAAEGPAFPRLGAAPGAAAPPPGSGISEALRAANRSLVEQIKRRLGDEARFGQFRERSAEWVRGGLSSGEYHDAVTALGLLGLVPELAATCPDVHKRGELLQAHAEAFAGGDGRRKGAARSGTWMPPEAAVAAAAHAAQHSSWQCGTCSLINAPAAMSCEACGHPKPCEDADKASNRWKQQASSGGAHPAAPAIVREVPEAAAALPRLRPARPAAPAAMFPPLPAAPPPGNGAATSASSGDDGAKKGKHKKKQSLTDFIQSTRAHPQNVWRNPTATLRGEWAGAEGALAQQERALNEAWSRS